MKDIYDYIMNEYLKCIQAVRCQICTGFVLLKIGDIISLERIVYDYDESELTFENDWWEGESNVEFINCITDTQIELLLGGKYDPK